VTWTTYLIRKQQANGLETLLAAVNVVPQEQVVGLGWKPSVLKEPQQIWILTMDIACANYADFGNIAGMDTGYAIQLQVLTANLDRGLELEQVGLAHENLFRCQT